MVLTDDILESFGFFFKHLVTLKLPLFEVHNPRMLGLKGTQRIFSPTPTHQDRKESRMLKITQLVSGKARTLTPEKMLL